MDTFELNEEEYQAFCDQQEKCKKSNDLFYIGVPTHPHLIVAVCGRYKTNCAMNICRDLIMGE
jgi:hypothetical protein